MKFLYAFFLCLILLGINTAEASGISFKSRTDREFLRPSHLDDMPANDVYLKIGQGVSFGRLLDQRMSNLHYTGPGLALSFSRYAENDRYISELIFAGIGFQLLQPRHEGTTVNNPSVGIRYSHLRKLNASSFADYRLGGQVEVFSDIRIAPALSNSFLYADFIGALQPRVDVAYTLYLFDLELSFDFSLAFGILGFGMRIPEYGASYQLGSSGSEVLTNSIQMLLHPGNYRHLVTGIHYNKNLGRSDNPNRLRIGYIWDYSHIRGAHNLSLYNTSHQLRLELLFLVN